MGSPLWHTARPRECGHKQSSTGKAGDETALTPQVGICAGTTTESARERAARYLVFKEKYLFPKLHLSEK